MLHTSAALAICFWFRQVQEYGNALEQATQLYRSVFLSVGLSFRRGRAFPHREGKIRRRVDPSQHEQAMAPRCSRRFAASVHRCSQARSSSDRLSYQRKPARDATLWHGGSARRYCYQRHRFDVSTDPGKLRLGIDVPTLGRFLCYVRGCRRPRICGIAPEAPREASS
jgi:hypothetical protein